MIYVNKWEEFKGLFASLYKYYQVNIIYKNAIFDYLSIYAFQRSLE